MSVIQDLRLIGVGFGRSGSAAQPRVDTSELDWFESRIGNVTSADDLLNDARLLRFTLEAFGLEHFSQSRDFLRRALSEGASDPASTANRFGGDALKELVATLGLDQAGAPNLDRWEVVTDISRRWAARDPNLTETLAARELDYFRANIAKVRTTGDLMANDRLYVFVMKAFGLEHAVGDRDLARRILDDGVTSPVALANRLSDPRYKEMATFLGLKENAGANLQRPEYVEGIADRYIARHPELKNRDSDLLGPLYERRVEMFRRQGLNAREIAYFKENIGTVQTVDDLFADDRLYRFVLKSFGLGDQANYKALMRQIITEGVSDPGSTANRMTDPRFKEMVAALGFEAVPANVGDPDQVIAVSTKYLTRHPEASLTGTDRFSREYVYYRDNIGKVETVDDLMKDVRLTNFLADAFDLTGPLADPILMRKVLTEGVPDAVGPLDDPRLADPNLRELASAFRFEIRRSSLSRPEAADVFIERFVSLGFEEEQGESNIGVRLALYFLRKMPEIAHRSTSEKSRLMEVLADKALSEVVFTAFGLPSQMAAMDLDRLVGHLDQKINLDDLRDPDKLMRFVERFATMYDLQNQEQGGTGILPLISPLSLDQAGKPSRPQIISIDPSVTMALLNFPRF